MSDTEPTTNESNSTPTSSADTDDIDVPEWPESKNIFGDDYAVNLTPGAGSGGKTLRSTGDDGNVYLGPTIRREFERAATYPEQAVWVGYWEDKAGLRTREVGIPLNSAFQHSFISGATGSGKTTVNLNTMTQLAYAGWGFCFVDPSGDAVKDLIQRIPDYRLDDIIWIQPPTGQYDYTTAMNFLEVEQRDDEPDATYDARVSSVVEELISIVGGDEEMFARMTRVLRTIAHAMIDADEPYTILDIYQLLGDPQVQKDFQDEVDDPVVADGIQRLSEDLDQAELEPLTGRLDKWVMNKTARRIISHRTSSVDIEQAVEDGKIILVNSNPGRIDSGVGKIIASAIVQRIWATVKARPERQTEDERRPYFLVIDELNEAISQSTDLGEMLSDARKYKLALNLATQFPHQLNDDRREAVLGNAKNLMAMKTTEGESARKIMDRMDDLTKQDLMNLSKYEMYTRLDTRNGLSPPLRIQAFPPYPPLRDRDAVERIIENSLERYGTRESGVTAENTVVNQLIRGDGELTLQTNTPDLDNIPTSEVLESIYAVEVRHGTIDNASYVPVRDVKTELENRVGDLGYISEIANLFETLPRQYVDMERRSGEVRIKLKPDGRAEATKQDTGSGVSGGGHNHRQLLTDAYEAFTELGCTVRLPSQDTENDLPDAIAELPVPTNPTIDDLNVDVNGTDINDLSANDLARVQNAMQTHADTLDEKLRDHHEQLPHISGARDLYIEAETTTITRPGQTLRNLRKAIEDDKRCIFTVPDGTHSDYPSVDAFVDWAIKGTAILTNPPLHAETTDRGRVLYNGDEYLTVEDTPVLRPADAGTTTKWVDPNPANTDTEWTVNDDHEFVLETNDGNPILSITANDVKTGGVNPAAVPAFGEYDRSQQQYIVKRVLPDGSLEELTYDDKEAFEAEWKRVSKPFVPEIEFPREPTTDDWRFVIFPDADNTQYDQPQLLNYNGIENERINWDLTPLFGDANKNHDLNEWAEQPSTNDTDPEPGAIPDTPDDTDTPTDTDDAPGTDAETTSGTADDTDDEDDPLDWMGDSIDDEPSITVEDLIEDDDDDVGQQLTGDYDTPDEPDVTESNDDWGDTNNQEEEEDSTEDQDTTEDEDTDDDTIF